LGAAFHLAKIWHFDNVEEVDESLDGVVLLEQNGIETRQIGHGLGIWMFCQ
jgi:hypothetical protein